MQLHFHARSLPRAIRILPSREQVHGGCELASVSFGAVVYWSLVLTLYEVLARVEAHVRQNLHRPLSISGLARVGNCSVAGIHRLFRHWHDETPAKWIAGERIEQAAYLLRTTRSPVKNIAEDVGIPDQFQFSRFFKRHAGCSPREYRKRQGIL